MSTKLLENPFVSNAAKLMGNIDRLAKFKETGELFPITLDIGPTGRCNQNCPFCSVKNRNRNEDLNLQDALLITKYYVHYGVKGIEMTGGGEPTLWPHFEEFIEKISQEPVKIGLITNGRLLHKYSPEFLRHFTWIRVSVNGIDEGWVPNFEIPPEVTFSFSYVWHRGTEDEKTNERLKQVLEKCPNAKALKIQKDVFIDQLNPISINPLTNSRVFIGDKGIETIPAKCFIGWLKPHLSADGKIYRCSTCALKERKFTSEFVMGDVDHLPLFVPDSKTFNPAQHCERCFYTAQNELVQKVMNPIEHSEFL